MKTLNRTKTTAFGLGLLAASFLLMGQVVSAQINIGGINIGKKRPDKGRTDQPAKDTTGTDNKGSNTGPTNTTKSTKAPDDDIRISLFLDDIKKEKQEVEIYTPADRLYLASRTQENFLLLAVSPRARQEFLTKWASASGVEKLGPALDGLAAALATKLPTYMSNKENYAFHNLAEEKMMKSALKNLATLKIAKIGLGENAWLIDKNDYGIPTARYKHGYIWARDSSDDHSYCHVYYVNIIQDYSGGGTYGASYANFINDELFGCP